MKIIPSEKIELTTGLSNQEVRKILRDNIRPKRGFRIGFNRPKDDKLFEGFFERDRFEIQRIIKGKNSFIPQIKGRIQTDINGTKLIADLKIHGFVIVFMTFWLVFVFLALIATIVGISTQGTNPLALIVPLIMMAFGIGLVHYGFNSEKDKSINDLNRILNARIKEKTFANNT
tara:strand:- start:588 stop:1109 length:522 start_codon:yes stop_codon:yes gene_type:complete